MSSTEFGLIARREWLKTVINRAGLQTVVDDLDLVLGELAEEWSGEDHGAELYLRKARQIIRNAAVDISNS